MKIAIISVLAAMLIIWGIAHFVVHGWHYQTSEGDHTGYITAAETNGVFFKTHTVYLKTNTQSTQEDSYCVVDPNVYNQLQQDSVAVTHVNVHFIDWLFYGWANCSSLVTGIITSVTPLNP